MIPIANRIIPSELSLLGLITVIAGLVIVWIIVSIPVYVAGKIVTGGKSSLGDAMVATLVGPIVYIIVLVAVDFFLGAVVDGGAFIWAFILAFLAWLWVYKSSFGTGWLGALAIAILAIITFVVLNVLIGTLFGLTMPETFFPRPL